jgi:hypothetical protein
MLTDERAWVRHPAGDDLAVCQILFDPKIYKFHYVNRGSFLDKETISQFNIGPGDDAFVVGRFINHEGKQRNNPTVRFGCVAQMPLEPIRQDTGFDQESFLVEIRSIGGYSGSPVFTHIPRYNSGAYRINTNWEYGPWLLGVDWGHIHNWEPVRDAAGRPVDPSGPPWRTQVRMNTGMMAVVPAWKLAELLDDGPVAENRRIEADKVVERIEKNPPQATMD